jgi:predicted transposase/invertase (TIGR01784 family)
VVFAGDLLLVTLELPKFNRTVEQLSGPLEVWLYFLRHAAELETDSLAGVLNIPEIRHALEELNMLSQNDVERERYLAREKMQRDRLSQLISAREEGLEKGQLIGAVHAFQRLLKQPLTPLEKLLQMAVGDLNHLAQQLEHQLSQ